MKKGEKFSLSILGKTFGSTKANTFEHTFKKEEKLDNKTRTRHLKSKMQSLEVFKQNYNICFSSLSL